MDQLFSAVELAKRVAEALPVDDPAGNVVVGSVDQGGLQIMASFTKKTRWLGGPTWELQAVVRHDWATGDNSTGARVLLRW